MRLEVEDTINPTILDLLISELNIDESEVYKLPAPLDLRGVGAIVRANRPALHYPKHIAHTSRWLNAAETAKEANVFAAARDHDVLLHHPYDSFATSVRSSPRPQPTRVCRQSSRPCTAPAATPPS